MRELGLRGVVPGPEVKTTTAVATLASPADRVNRVFQATRERAWVADITHLATWTRVRLPPPSSSTPLPGASWAGGSRTRYVPIFALDALEQALYERSVSRVTAWSITAIVDRSICLSATPNAWPRPDRAIGGQRRRFLR